MSAISALPSFVWQAGGTVGLFSVLFIALVKGWVIVGSVHKEQIADKDSQIIAWRAVAETSQAQMGELLQSSRLTVQLLQGIDARAKAGDDR